MCFSMCRCGPVEGMGPYFIHGKTSNEDLLGLHDGPGELFELLGHGHDGRQAFLTSCGCDPVEQAAWWFRVPRGFVEENLGHAVIRSGAMFVDVKVLIRGLGIWKYMGMAWSAPGPVRAFPIVPLIYRAYSR